jgi:Tfp pilus assembly protein PilP
MKKTLLVMIIATFFAASCGKPGPSGPAAAQVKRFAPKPVAVVYQKKEPPVYRYSGDRYRDPFIPLAGQGAYFSENEESAIPNIASLTLKGIIGEGKTKIALISGAGSTYILKGGRLYDNRQRQIKGITGAIKTDSVIMIAPDKTVKELKLREKDKY